MRHIYIVTMIFFYTIIGYSQQITLNECFKHAEKNYPLLIQKGILEQSFSETNSLINKNWYPQVDFSAQLTTQSDVTKIPIKIPNMTIPEPEKEQYKATIDIKQLIWDGGYMKKERTLKKVENSIEQQKLEIDILKLKEKISQLFFRVIHIDENIEVVNLQIEDINIRLKTIQAGVNNGIILKSNADKLKVEILKLNQRVFELTKDKQSLIASLNILLGLNLTSESKLILPQSKNYSTIIANRPELELFELQKQYFSTQSKTTIVKNLPRLSAFAQGGYGKPALNMFDPDFQFYYIAGIRLNWNIWNWNTGHSEKKIYSLAQQIVDKQKDIFNINIQIQIEQQKAEITKIELLLKTDDEIIEIQTSIKKSAVVQFENGTLSANDYLNELNNEKMLLLNKKMHQIQLIMSQINLQIILGELDF